MDTPAQVFAAVIGSGGLSGIAVHGFALWREKKGWRAEMEARLRKVEQSSPDALLKRLEQTEEFRSEDKREIDRQLSRLKAALNTTMDALSKIQERLGITTV
jgi:hypothetical protein